MATIADFDIEIDDYTFKEVKKNAWKVWILRCALYDFKLFEHCFCRIQQKPHRGSKESCCTCSSQDDNQSVPSYRKNRGSRYRREWLIRIINYFKKEIFTWLFKQLSFYFLDLFLAKVSEHSERCWVKLFECTTYYFRRNTFDLCPSLFDYLFDSFFRDLVDLSTCIFDNARCDFSELVDSVSSSVREIITVEKPISLSAPLISSKSSSSPTSSGGSSQVSCVFFLFSYFWIKILESLDNKYPTMSPFSTIYLLK